MRSSWRRRPLRDHTFYFFSKIMNSCLQLCLYFISYALYIKIKTKKCIKRNNKLYIIITNTKIISDTKKGIHVTKMSFLSDFFFSYQEIITYRILRRLGALYYKTHPLILIKKKLFRCLIGHPIHNMVYIIVFH